MSSSPRTALPSALSQALASGRLVVVAGAGISMLPPSNLPSWWAFNQQLLSSIKAAASGLLPAAAHRLLDALSLEGGIPVVAFSDHVVRTFAGPAYFPLLRVLESSRPNANHRALAELARQGRLRAIVTTNFDTLIERAFREAGVDLEVLVGSGSHGVLDGRGRAATALHKVHGSVSDANSLVDTVSQKARGLGHEQRAALERAFAGSHVLFVGFSGADFDFDPDYLPLQGALEAGRSFTWVSRKGSPAPEVARRLARSPDWLVEGELPGWFEALGVDGHAMRGAVDAQPAAVPTPSLQDRIDAWIASPGFGPWACAALCLRLLNDLRLHGERAAFEDWLRVAAEARLDDPGGLDIRADGGIGAALRQLATSALDQGDFPAARAWCERENRFLEALHAKATSLGSLSDRGRREYWCNTAGVYINLALALLRDPGAPDRRQALDAAMNEAGHRARQANDPGLLALLSIGLAQDEERPPTERLRHLRTAQAFAIHAGANQSLIESLHMQARLLMDLSELRLAQIALDDARERLKLATGDALRWAQQALEAALAIREGDADRARAASERMLEIAGQDPPMLKATARQLLADLGWQPDPTDALSTLWDELLARLAGPDPTLAESLRQAWLDRRADPAALPAFLPAPPKPAGEPGDSDLRAALAWAEFRRDDARCLSCLEALCRSAHARGEAWRLRDLASALSWRAQKSGRTQTAMVAGNYLGVAHELAADLEAAASAWQAALALDDGGRWPGLAATIQANLARILTQAGDVAQAQALFETARATLRAQGSWSNYCVATVNQARLFGQEGQVASAVRLVTDAAALMASRGQERLGAALGQLAIEFGENQAGPNTRMRAWTPSTTWLREAEIHQVDGSSPPAPSPSSAQQLATKAMVSWEAGDEEAGRRLNAEARALYERQGDLAGASRCWNNLAMMQMAADQIPAAIESTRLALALRMRTPDTEGQVMTHATLAALLLRDHRFEASLDVVAEGLILAGSEPGKSWEVVRLHLGGLRAALALQRWAEGRLRCRALAQALQGVDHPQRALVEAEIGEANELLDAVDAVDAARDGEKAEVGAHAMDAVRQARTQARGGNPAQAIAGLEAALRDGGDPAPNGIDRGTLHGELANLLAATDPAGALAHYALSSRAYEEAGRTGMAWHARGVAALLRVDTGAESVESLLSWVDACPEATVSLNVLTGCANVLVARAREGVEERALWEGLRRRLASGIATGRADAETLGRACLQWVGACRACEDKAEASRALELARRHLARSNSRYLDHLSTHESAIGEMKD